MTAGQHQSLWIATAPAPARPPLRNDLDVDVAIVGAGMVGLTSAYLLQKEGLKVAVLERGRILEGVTGKTTAKVTSQHGLVYDTLAKRFGEDKARLHAQASETARATVARLVQEVGAQADLTRAPNYVYTTDSGQVEGLRREAEAARRLGLPAEFTRETELPFEVRGAVRFDDQAHFHPRKYLVRLAEAVAQGGGHVHENTPALEVEDGTPCKVTTPGGTVRARHAIVATHVPVNDRAWFVTRIQVKREYVLALPYDGPLKGMYVSADSPRRSVRPYDGDGERLLVVAGESHPIGEHTDTTGHYQALEHFAREHFGAGPPRYYWSTQDAYPTDELPLIGRYSPTAKHTWTATGFRAWGMTQSTVAALMFADEIAGRASPWRELYDPFSPARLLKGVANPSFLKQQGVAMKGLVGRRLERHHFAELGPGEGRVVDLDHHKVATCRTRDGAEHAVFAACTHMGCIVSWNLAEQSWDCPCHGSRFAPDGQVLHGPAAKPLGDARATLPETR
jgi:glycine/D-amino acid oxidase-like deaminating enzyme/nitrite reductase/ring-hydroxylating ferredoxin subunit